jgi:S-formylglutathione hydrolase FrmB
MTCIRLCLLAVLLLQGSWSFGARVDTVTVPSAVMQKHIRAAVVLPEAYKKSKRPFPVLYLLHGGTGSYRDWLSKTPDKALLHRLADQYKLIIVTPDAGPTSYYFDSPVDKTSQYETFISRELVAKIDDSYRTVRDRKGRVISGLSMGGHGAIYLATRHPDLYCAAGSMSGVMDINTASWQVPAEFAQSRAQNFARLLGPPRPTGHPYPDYTALGLTDKIQASGLPLLFDCGVDDFLIGPNRELHRRLVYLKVPHDYTERPGGHTWEYWQNALPYQVLFLTKVLRAQGSMVP